ncbi:TonB-dependent receptor family protein [Flavihumibacter stibioxidans]|uniref:TonB-dependent receptor family protein n=1 Tax=Flavihumibacter stibioxidans TaxID=1834163 RepID=UPI00164EE93B|nr:TonB-dependent receptor plug domain-containing protein [Flavihumibacter stibioxidans]
MIELKIVLAFATMANPGQPLLSDTTLPQSMDSVVVTAFANRSSLKDAAASLSVLKERDWQRFSPASAVGAVNSLPGVRMEERSPGSYRLAIRGSSLRSPFGVRNIRMYYEGLPFTDPGGNTYLNQFAVGNFGQLEVLKGPGNSLYGAGTGGTILAGTPSAGADQLSLQYMAGSYGLHQLEAKFNLPATGFRKPFLQANAPEGPAPHQFYAQHQVYGGYRNHSEMKRDMFSYLGHWKTGERSTLSLVQLVGDLWYQTPGGLTLAEYQKDPRQSRPAAGPNPSAEATRAAISQRTIYSGLRHEWKPTERIRLDIAAYGAKTNVTNPAIRNYEKRSEPHYGTRLNFAYTLPLNTSRSANLRLNAGGEWQQGHYRISVYGNNAGEPGSLQTDDRLRPRTALLFTQGILDLPMDWQFTAGLSYNANKVQIRRISEQPVFEFTSNYRNEWMPRLALTKKLGPLTFYGMIAKGFSPPTTSELLPSTSVINTSLQAEGGWNQELGVRGRVLRQQLYFDLDFFYFRLKDAIVQRRDASGADYFDNAGGTRQKGMEAYISWSMRRKRPNRPAPLQAWASYTLHHFKYDDFKQGTNDFSGNFLPGVARQTLVTGIDLNGPAATSLHLTYQYVDPMWLNDANTARAAQYHLLAARIATQLWQTRFKGGRPFLVRFFAGADNLFNTQYSLGNDINAFGGRYYNLSAGRNFYVGLQCALPYLRAGNGSASAD